jgi:excisionase family DNA binding protein
MREMNHRFVSTLELGALLGVTRQTVRNWIKKGDIKAFHIGQNLKIPVQEAVRILSFYELPVPDWLLHEKLSSSQHPTNDRPVKEDLSWSSHRAGDKTSRGKQDGLFEARR